MDWTYGTAVDREGDDFTVSVRDLPEVVTSGDSEAEALDLAADAIEVSVGFRMEKGEALPRPTPVRNGEHGVALPALSAVKATLYMAWRDAGIPRSELARRIGQGENEIRRVLALGHRTKLDRLEEVANALGLKLTVEVVPQVHPAG